MARMLIVGAGVVGMATGKGFTHLGHEVVYKDTAPARIVQLTSQDHAVWTDASSFAPDLIFICVGTPTIDGQADLSQVEAACRDLGPLISKASTPPTVVVRSTLPPGTMTTKVVPWLEAASARRADIDFFVCFNPEFLRRATAEDDFLRPWAILIGRQNPAGAQALLDCLKPLTDREGVSLQLTDFATAELTKYAANLFNATKISFANQIWLAGQSLGIDANLALELTATAAEGMWNPAYGIKGGFPFGGGCLPKDLEAFLGLAAANEIPASLLEAVAKINALVPSDGRLND